MNAPGQHVVAQRGRNSRPGAAGSPAVRTHGGTYAIRETADWDSSAQLEARREVATELEVKIKPDWSERDEERLVDDVLDDWEDDENENDDGAEEDEQDDWDEEE